MNTHQLWRKIWCDERSRWCGATYDWVSSSAALGSHLLSTQLPLRPSMHHTAGRIYPADYAGVVLRFELVSCDLSMDFNVVLIALTTQ